MNKSMIASVAALLATSSLAFAHGAHPGSGFPNFDRDGNGVVTRDEMRATAVEQFEKNDANKDGRVTLDEVQAGEQARHAAHFAAKDKDGDGKLSRAEVAEMPDQMFKHLDQNGDGVLTKDELQKGPFGGMAARHFEHADSNHDGSISRDEVLAEVDKRFAHMDTSGDGLLTQDELKMHHGGPGGGHGCQHDGQKTPAAR